ncbi:MAG: YceI family protein [Verrucomicrobia bacterium]|nr:YceI family protein [Verrucomicrobiota bacterium]
MRTKTIIGLTTAVLLAFSYANAADNYKIDPAHTSVGFSVRHMGVSNVKGHFDDFSGLLVLDNGSIQEASGTIQVKSVNTGMEKRDNHLRTTDFFDAAKYPLITFKSKRVEKSGEQTVLIADFTMRGVTKELRLPVTLSGPVKDPMGNTRIGLEAKTTVNRKDYGIQFNALMETGGLVVGEEVALEINAEATKDAAVTGANK